MPTPEEWVTHQLTHFPFRPWCNYCVCGRSRDDHHQSAEKEHGGQPVLEVDFFFMGNREDLEKAIGLTVVDLNETRTVQLIENGEFVDVTMQFDYDGPVNVTMRVLDNRGEGIQLETTVAVNSMESTTTAGDNLYAPGQSGCQHDTHVDGFPLIAQQFYTTENFNVNKGAKWVSVTATGTDHVAICAAADDSSLGGGASSAETEEMDWLTGPTNYYIAAFPSGAQQVVTFDVVVHYENKPAA